MFVILFFSFLTAMFQARIDSLSFFKESDGLFFFPANWLLLIVIDRYSPRETTVDIVLDVSENSHSSVFSEVLSKVVAYQHRVYQFFQIIIFPRFSEHRRGF